MKSKDVGSYLCVAGAVAISFLIAAVYSTQSLVFEKILEQFGAAKSTTASVFSLFSLVGYGSVWAVALCTERFGCRRVAICGGIMQALAVGLAGFTPSVYYLYISYGLLLALGISFCFEPGYIILNLHFKDREKTKGQAMAIKTAGSPLGAIVFPPLVQIMFDHYGYFGTMLILSGLSLNICAAAGLLIPPRTYHRTTIQNNDSLCSLNTSGTTNRDDIKTVMSKPEQNPILARDGVTYVSSNVKSENNISAPNEISTNRELSLEINNNKHDLEDIKWTDEDDKILRTDGSAIAFKRKERVSSLVLCFESIKSTCFNSLRTCEVLTNPALLSFSVYVGVAFLADGCCNLFIAGLAAERGISHMQSAWVLTLAGVVDCLARLTVGKVYDHKLFRERRFVLFSVLSAFMGILMSLIPVARSLATLAGIWSSARIIRGLSTSQNYTILSDLTQEKIPSAAMGITSLFKAIGSGLAPVVGAKLQEWTGSYDLTYHLTGGLGAAASLALLAVASLDSDKNRPQFSEKDVCTTEFL